MKKHLFVISLLISQHISYVFGWRTFYTNVWRKCKTTIPAATIISTLVSSPLQTNAVDMASISPFPSGTSSIQISSESPTKESLVEKDKYTFDQSLVNSLQPPTDETPQVMLPADFLNQRKEKPLVVEGLLFLVNQEKRPSYTDTLVLTAKSLQSDPGSNSGQDTILAGAKIPVSKVRFPMNFRMFKENAVPGKQEEWAKALENSDIIVNAQLCPEGVQLPCSKEEVTLKGNGLSKIVRNLPGVSEAVTVRAAASVPLDM